jgi:plastin-3
MEEYDLNHSREEKGKLNYNEFELICQELWANDPSSTFENAVSKRENLETLGGISTASSEGTTHSIRLEEQLAFSDWINSNLAGDEDLGQHLPIDPEGKDLYEKVKDGILFW